MKIVLSVLALLCFISLFSMTKQEIFDGSCAKYNVQPMTGFKKRIYDGLWFVYRLNDYADSLNQDCLTWNYLPITSKNAVSIQNGTNLQTNESKQINSTMYFDTRGWGQFTYDVVTDDEVPEYCKVIETDYETYSVEWSCVDNSDSGRCDAFVYVMTRKPIPDQATITICENILLRHGIDISSTRLVNQDKDLCGYAN